MVKAQRGERPGFSLGTGTLKVRGLQTLCNGHRVTWLGTRGAPHDQNQSWGGTGGAGGGTSTKLRQGVVEISSKAGASQASGVWLREG